MQKCIGLFLSLNPHPSTLIQNPGQVAFDPPDNPLPGAKIVVLLHQISREKLSRNCQCIKTLFTMAIKVKAVERNVSFDKNSEKWAYVLQAEMAYGL